MTQTTQAESGKKVDIECDLELEPMSDACLGFDKTWESAVRSKLRQSNFYIIKSNNEVSPETGKCSASITVIYVGPQKDIDFPLESDDSFSSPTISKILSILQKSYERSKPNEERVSIYAALSVNGNFLEKPSNTKNQESEEKTKSHDKEEQDNNSSEEDFDKVETEELFPHVEDKPRYLTSFNLNSGTIKFSDGCKIQLSREFNDNFSIDVTDLVLTSKLTMNGNNVNALNPDAEGKLARRLSKSLDNVKAAIKERNPSSSSTGGMDESGSDEENE